MKLVYKVAAHDEAAAEKIFQALSIDYDLDSIETRQFELNPAQDAVIVATFPTQKLTPLEIRESADLDTLREQLLMRYNSRFRNAVFEIRVPEQFDLDLFTSAGPIRTSDVNGQAQLVSSGGYIEVGNISGKAELKTNAGYIFAGDLDADAKLITNGGDIETGNISGQLIAKSSGGHVRAESVNGPVDVQTLGGQIELGRTLGPVRAESLQGNIVIWKAAEHVQATAPAGAISVNFTGQPTGDSTLTTEGGSIEVGYHDGIDLEIDAQSEQGSISSPFADFNATALHHQMNGGKFRLNAHADAGKITFSAIDEDKLSQKLSVYLQQIRGRRAFQRAYNLHASGKLDQAIEAHQHAAKFEGHRAVAFYNLGCAWALKGKKDRAFAELNKAIDFGFRRVEQFEKDEDLNTLTDDQRFAALIKRLQNPANTEKRVENYLLDEMRARQVFQTAYELHLDGKIDEAIQAHQRAAKFNEYRAVATYNLGCAWALKGETAKALDALDRAIDFGFKDITQFESDGDLHSLRNENRFQQMLSRLKNSSKQKADRHEKRNDSTATRDAQPANDSMLIAEAPFSRSPNSAGRHGNAIKTG
jgi:DUF4097 and DUF4098 domain-containing protein YvlB